jgi:hypothetical protein
VRFSAEIRHEASDPATVFAMMTDTTFQDRVCRATGALDHEVSVEEFDDGGATITTRRTMPTDRVPDFVRTFVGQTLVVEEIDDWGPAAPDGSREGTVVVEIKGAPVRLAGSLALRPAGGGSVHAVDGDVKASVPLVGGRIEKAIEPALQAAITVQQREGTAWLAAR